jgi:hypothetical protein
MLYDFGVPVALIWYWYTFFRDARRLAAEPQPPPGQARITQQKVTQQNQVTQEKPVAPDKPVTPDKEVLPKDR